MMPLATLTAVAAAPTPSLSHDPNTPRDRVPEFALPPELEAREPPEARGLRRDQVRLLVTHRESGRVGHYRFADLPDVLRPGDLLVVNDSGTLPAALTARRADGTAVALHLSTSLPASLWIVEPRQTRVDLGEVLALPGGGVARIVASYPGSQRLWIAQLQLRAPAFEYLARVGRPIAYPYVRGEWPLAMYQTVYAREPGSAEMPSAGRAFTPDVLARSAARGIGLARITLHTGVASLERDEPPIEEWYRVPREAVAAIEAARERGRRVIAVGTTVVRALESAVDPRGRLIASQGWTDLVITPERRIRTVDALLTGFHEPRASHLAMLTAFAGRTHLEHAYRAAIAGGYLWHEFGDLHLIL
ncbi:MAG TPA: S-adenosylmethionine:tRNA ribosyltransferase-isomerase [bacterium]|nr:S-adenosylmethionine:tRNA ribosyltransferase-isomerase [bacterium]